MSGIANEFRISNQDKGKSKDEALHRSMLAKQSASDAADIVAVGQAIAGGMDPQEAASMFASPSAIAILAKSGVIKLPAP